MKSSRIFLNTILVISAVLMLFTFASCKKEKAECDHDWGSFETMVEATCHSEGAKKRYCASCGAEESETIAKKEHEYTAVRTSATCVTKGKTVYTCTCGDTYTEEDQTISGHTYTAVVTPPTCTAEGYTTHTCASCGDSYVDTKMEKTPHAYAASSVVTKPTCTEEGYTTYICVCNETKIDNWVDALGHDFSEWVNGVSTCQNPNCGETKTATTTLTYDKKGGETWFVTGIEGDPTGEIIIPNMHEGIAVTGIAANAFAGKSGITSFDIPDTITTIEDGAFTGTAAIKTEGGISYVDNWVITVDADITVLVLPGTVKGIAKNALGAARLTKIRFLGKGQDWLQKVTRPDGWNNALLVVCDDGQIVNGVFGDGDDTSNDVFD